MLETQANNPNRVYLTEANQRCSALAKRFLLRHRALAVVLVVAGGIALAEPGSAAPGDPQANQPIKVGFCELIQSPEQYSGKTIETSGLYWHNFENSLLQLPGCPDDTNKNPKRSGTKDRREGIRDTIFVGGFSPSKDPATGNDSSGPGCQTKAPKGSASVTLTGRFRHAPDIYTKMPNGELVINPAFGHLHQYRNLIEVDCLRVLIDLPW